MSIFSGKGSSTPAAESVPIADPVEIEIEAIKACYLALARLSVDARVRVLSYVQAIYSESPRWNLNASMDRDARPNPCAAVVAVDL